MKWGNAARIGALLLVAGALAACGNGDPGPPMPQTTGGSTTTAIPHPSAATTSTTTTSPAARPAGPEIVISGRAYSPPITVSPGQQVTIVNDDEDAHSVTADASGAFDVRVSGGGGTITLTAPSEPGTYPFHCKYHTDMHGMLTVQ